MTRRGTCGVGPLLNTLELLGALGEVDGEGSLDGATAGHEAWVEDDIARHGQRVLQIPLHLV
jgi:hypothetical protein